MDEIRISQAVAQNIAAKLDQSLQSIHQHQINYAEQTTVGGNRDAKETIQAKYQDEINNIKYPKLTLVHEEEN